MTTNEITSAPSPEDLASAAAFGRAMVEDILSGDMELIAPKADPVDTATRILAENLQKFGEHAETLTAHAKSAMLSKLSETQKPETAPELGQCIRNMPLSVWAVAFAHAVVAQDDPNSLQPVMDREMQKLTHRMRMSDLIDGEIADPVQQKAYLAEFDEHFRAELQELPKPAGDFDPFEMFEQVIRGRG